jgi:lysophospholipase
LDQLVDNSSIKRRMADWPNGEFSMIRNAKHDVLTETAEVGGDVIGHIADFFTKHGTAAKPDY